MAVAAFPLRFITVLSFLTRFALQTRLETSDKNRRHFKIIHTRMPFYKALEVRRKKRMSIVANSFAAFVCKGENFIDPMPIWRRF